jgi:hypothetical protein
MAADRLNAVRDAIDADVAAISHAREITPPDDESPPLDVYVGDVAAVAGEGADGQRDRQQRVPALDWAVLETQTPPERQWAIDHWLGMGHVTLFAGAGGTGKTGTAQAMGSCLALQREYLDYVPAPCRVLLWACEDDADELWRRQAAIARWLKVPLSAFSDCFFVHSYDGRQVELANLVDRSVLAAGSMLGELRQQIGDYKANVVMLDNLARLYGGNENDRHQVTSFVAMLTAAAAPTKAAVLLLGHPSKAAGSEYSGSTAWEGAVRARLYLGRTLPDADQKEHEPAEDDTVRYLCRRKANYTTRDWRRLHFRDGVMVPEVTPELITGRGHSSDYIRGVIERAVRKLAEMGEYGTASSASPNYLPKLALNYKLLERLTQKEFTAGMHDMRKDGQLIVKVVGKYGNRNPREGLVLRDGPEAHK